MVHEKTLHKVAIKTADFFLPPLCPVTGEMVEKNGMVSPAYWQSLSFIHDPLCQCCGAPFAFEADEATCGLCLDHPPTYHTGRSALIYNDASRNLILKFKHGDQTHAVKAFTPWLLQAGKELFGQCDLIMPVPLHPLRLIKRRYNQAELISRDLAKNLPTIAHIPDGLKRIRSTESQRHKKKDERRRNIAKAFIVNPKYRDFIKGKSILLVDDVLTTGATLNECARTLFVGGADQVHALTLARVVKD